MSSKVAPTTGGKDDFPLLLRPTLDVAYDHLRPLSAAIGVACIFTVFALPSPWGNTPARACPQNQFLWLSSEVYRGTYDNWNIACPSYLANTNSGTYAPSGQRKLSFASDSAGYDESVDTPTGYFWNEERYLEKNSDNPGGEVQACAICVPCKFGRECPANSAYTTPFPCISSAGGHTTGANATQWNEMDVQSYSTIFSVLFSFYVFIQITGYGIHTWSGHSCSLFLGLSFQGWLLVQLGQLDFLSDIYYFLAVPFYNETLLHMSFTFLLVPQVGFVLIYLQFAHGGPNERWILGGPVPGFDYDEPEPSFEKSLWRCFFNFLRPLLWVLWLLLGAMMYSNRWLAFTTFFRFWNGNTGGLEEAGDGADLAALTPILGTMIVCEITLESIPQIIVQMMNNSMLNEWELHSVAPMIFSVYLLTREGFGLIVRISARGSIIKAFSDYTDKTIGVVTVHSAQTQLEEQLKVALANEDFSEAAVLKERIAQAKLDAVASSEVDQEKQDQAVQMAAKISELEQKKTAAIQDEDYAKAADIKKSIADATARREELLSTRAVVPTSLTTTPPLSEQKHGGTFANPRCKRGCPKCENFNPPGPDGTPNPTNAACYCYLCHVSEESERSNGEHGTAEGDEHEEVYEYLCTSTLLQFKPTGEGERPHKFGGVAWRLKPVRCDKWDGSKALKGPTPGDCVFGVLFENSSGEKWLRVKVETLDLPEEKRDEVQVNINELGGTDLFVPFAAKDDDETMTGPFFRRGVQAKLVATERAIKTNLWCLAHFSVFFFAGTFPLLLERVFTIYAGTHIWRMATFVTFIISSILAFLFFGCCNAGCPPGRSRAFHNVCVWLPWNFSVLLLFCIFPTA